jgi:hypothetical protein
VATVELDWAPGCGAVGVYDVNFTASDDFDPPGVTERTLTIVVECAGSLDCNENDVPDECDIAEGTSEDCNDNGVPDECDIEEGTSLDCQPNEIPDECDIEFGTSADDNGNDVPDECEACVYETCAGDYAGAFAIDGWEGILTGTLAADGGLSLSGDDLGIVVMIECDGSVSWIIMPYGYTFEGQISTDDGCNGSGVFLEGEQEIGTWSISQVVN